MKVRTKIERSETIVILLSLYSMSSGLLGGVGRDAKNVVEHLASRPVS